jgi:hypothetical protein
MSKIEKHSAPAAAGTPVCAVSYPGAPPGPAQCTCTATHATLENAAIAMQWSFADGRLKPVRLFHKAAGLRFDLGPFELITLEAIPA